jgi:hypothetical protein
MKFKKYYPNVLVVCLLVPALSYSSSLFIPDSDTGLLLSLATNTIEQLARLEKLVDNSNEQLQYTKKLKETADSIESSYERLTGIQNTLNALVAVKDTSPENLEEINNKIEEIQDQRERVLDLIKKSKEVQAKSEGIEKDSKSDNLKVTEVVKLDQSQIKKAHSSSVRNQTQEVAKNTAYISSKMTETNLLLRKNIETTAQTNSLFAKNMAITASENQKQLEYIGAIKKSKNQDGNQTEQKNYNQKIKPTFNEMRVSHD